MPTDISLLRRCRDQEITIARLMDESQLLRDQNADLLAQLDAARPPLVSAGGIGRLEATLPVSAAAPATARRRLLVVANAVDRLEATLPVSPTAPVTARTTLTRWLSGHVPLDVLEDARLLASELISNSLLRPDISEDDLLRLAVELGKALCGWRCGIPGRPAWSPRASPIASAARARPAARRRDRDALGRQPHGRDAGVVRGRRRGGRRTRLSEAPTHSPATSPGS